MNLAMMRDIDAADPIGTLGPRVTPAPTPAPAPVRRGDGFIVGPDGKLSTDLPDPTLNPPGWEPVVIGVDFGAGGEIAVYVHTPPTVAVCAREPLKAGDRVRRLKPSPAGTFPAGYVHIVWDICTAAVVLEGDGGDVLWSNEGITWERVK